LNGYCFLRQKPINEYIVDFYCREVKLVTGIEGLNYNDKQRETRIQELGFHVIRLDGYYVVKDIHAALESIIGCNRELEKKTSPYPPSKGEFNFARV